MDAGVELAAAWEPGVRDRELCSGVAVRGEAVGAGPGVLRPWEVGVQAAARLVPAVGPRVGPGLLSRRERVLVAATVPEDVPERGASCAGVDPGRTSVERPPRCKAVGRWPRGLLVGEPGSGAVPGLVLPIGPSGVPEVEEESPVVMVEGRPRVEARAGVGLWVDLVREELRSGAEPAVPAAVPVRAPDAWKVVCTAEPVRPAGLGS